MAVETDVDDLPGEEAQPLDRRLLKALQIQRKLNARLQRLLISVGERPASAELAQLLDQIVAEANATLALAVEIKQTFVRAPVTRRQRVVQRARAILGTSEKATRWLSMRNPALDGEAPDALLNTESGAERVDEVLTRIEHGVLE